MSDIYNFLMEYLPDYYSENKEMLYLTEAEIPELDALWNAIENVKLNQFIMTCDENQLRRWEKLLRIVPDYALQSMDYRKAVVIMRLSTRIPLTYRWLLEKMAETFGEGNFSAEVLYNDYLLSISIFNDNAGLHNDFMPYLREKAPANLCLFFNIIYEALGGLFTGGAVVGDETDAWIRDKLPEDINVTGKLFIGSAVGGDITNAVLRDKYLDDTTIQSTQYYAAGIWDISSITIPSAVIREEAV